MTATRCISTGSSNECLRCYYGSRTCGRGRSRADPFGKMTGHRALGLREAKPNWQVASHCQVTLQSLIDRQPESRRGSSTAAKLPRYSHCRSDSVGETSLRCASRTNVDDSVACLLMSICLLLTRRPIGDGSSRVPSSAPRPSIRGAAPTSIGFAARAAIPSSERRPLRSSSSVAADMLHPIAATATPHITSTSSNLRTASVDGTNEPTCPRDPTRRRAGRLRQRELIHQSTVPVVNRVRTYW